MTTEIALLNKSAVALAADSAVTIATRSGGSHRVTKIYAEANKLFELRQWPAGWRDDLQQR